MHNMLLYVYVYLIFCLYQVYYNLAELELDTVVNLKVKHFESLTSEQNLNTTDATQRL